MPSFRFEPPHLGQVLRSEYLDDYQMTAADLARAIEVPCARVEAILSGNDPVDADMALRLARLFGGSAEGWLRWQLSHDLWRAHRDAQEELESIVPLDPLTRLSEAEVEPLDEGAIGEVRRRAADVRDPRPWVVASVHRDEDVPLDAESLHRMFYDTESGCYCTDILSAPPFKREAAAEAVAATLGPRVRTIQVTTQDLEGPRRDESTDRELRRRYFQSTGRGMSDWDVGVYLSGAEDMAAYLEAAAEIGDGALLVVAVSDVMKAMAAQAANSHVE